MEINLEIEFDFFFEYDVKVSGMIFQEKQFILNMTKGGQNDH